MSWIWEGMACRGGRPSRLGEGDAMHAGEHGHPLPPAATVGHANAARSAACRKVARRGLGLSSSGEFDGGHATKTRERARTEGRLLGAKRVGRAASASSLRVPSNPRPSYSFALYYSSFLSLFSSILALYTIHDVAQLYRANCCDCTECSTKTDTHLYHSRPAPLVALAQCSTKTGAEFCNAVSPTVCVNPRVCARTTGWRRSGWWYAGRFLVQDGSSAREG